MNKKLSDQLHSFPKDYELSKEAKMKIELALQEEIAKIEKQGKPKFQFKLKEGMRKMAIPITSSVVVALAVILFVSSEETPLSQFREETPAVISEEEIEQVNEKDKVSDEIKELATIWAEALKLRDGKPRYDMLANDAKDKFLEEQVISNGEDGIYVIGVSSPWVVDFDIEVDGMNAIITYLMQTSDPAYFETKEIITFKKENDTFIVESFETIYEDEPVNIDGQIIDGEARVTEPMHDAISNFIIEQHKHSGNGETDVQFEVHKVYGTKQEGDEMTVYLWSYYNTFNRETGNEIVSGVSMPVVVTLKLIDLDYEVIDYEFPKDGSDYASSIHEMFPAKYLGFISQHTDYMEELKAEMEEKVEQWLKQE